MDGSASEGTLQTNQDRLSNRPCSRSTECVFDHQSPCAKTVLFRGVSRSINPLKNERRAQLAALVQLPRALELLPCMSGSHSYSHGLKGNLDW
jgi:hypothetical protein